MALGRFDHLVVSSATLIEGVAFIEDLLEVPMAGGGDHPLMGTHNSLLSLGPDAYLEVIAVNPRMRAPNQPRWFDLDYFTGDTRLTNWVIGTDDIQAALKRAPVGTGLVHDLARSEYRWEMAIPEDGRLPFKGCAPGVLSWRGKSPVSALPDQGVRLAALEISHPEAEALAVSISPLIDDPRLSLHTGEPGISAWLDTPKGMVKL